MPLHFSAWRHALNKAGATFEFSWQLFTSRAGMSLPLTVEELSAQFNIQLDPDAVARSQYEHYRALENQVKPVPGVLEFARDVAKRAPISVASGSSRESVERTLSTIGARDLFEILVTPESVEHGKPAPDMFLLAAKLMQVPAQDCLVLEDAEFGFEAARRAQKRRPQTWR